jgi:hypothetical protein
LCLKKKSDVVCEGGRRWNQYSKLLLQRAIQVFAFTDKYRGAYSDNPIVRAGVCPFYCNYNGYEDELLWGAAWLHRATGKREYRNYECPDLLEHCSEVQIGRRNGKCQYG